MRLHGNGLGRGVLVGAALLAFSCVHAGAQTNAAQSNAEQKTRVPARVTDTVDDTNRTVLRGNVHPKARAEFDNGAVADATPVTRILLLLQRSAEQEAALRQLMEEQQSKSSPNYHAWLTPEDFGKKFGPADADVQTVTDWLTSHGFQNIKVAKGKTVVEFSGNAGQVRKAFATEIHKYNVNGEEHFANASDPQIPAAIAPVVRGIRSLHNFHPKPQARTLGSFRRTANGEIRPLFTYTDSNGQFFAMGPADFAKIYNIPASATGAGQHIAIVGQSNINLQDVTDFRAIFGLPAYTAGQLNVILNGPDPGLVGSDETESDLDVEWAGAVAPAATIDFVTTQTAQTDGTFGIDGSALYIVENNIAPVLSESYGACEPGLGAGGNAFYNSLWQQAAAQGITVVISAGDNGSAGCDPAAAPANQDVATQGLAVSGIASTPFNIALGGTDFDDAGNQSKFWNATNSSTSAPPASALGYIPEKTWNDSCASAGSTSGCSSATINSNAGSGIDVVAGSGGPSSIYSKPSYQTGFLSDSTRDIPDVSLFSSDNGAATGLSNSFYIVCQSDQDPTGGTGCDLTTSAGTSAHNFQAVGGTSAATPTFAAIMALVIQQQAGQRQGVANYVLYSLAKTAVNVCPSTTATLPNACVFYDVTKGNNSVACAGGSANCSNKTTGQFGILTTTAGGSTPAFNATTGYDLATGLGSVNVANLLAKWASPSRTATTTSLSLSATSITVGSTITVSGTVTPTSATGLVVLKDMATGAEIQPSCPTSSPLCTANAVSAGSYSFPTAFLPGGTAYNVVAHYGGDGTFATSDSAPMTVTVAKQNSQTVVNFVTATGALTTAAQNIIYGSPYILRIDVENATGQTCQNLSNTTTLVTPLSFICPTGAVTLTDGGKPLNDFPRAQNLNVTNVANLNDRGFAEDQPVSLPVGSHTVAASYPGDASYNASASNSLSVTVTQATTSIAVTPSPTSIASGGSVTLTALVTTPSNGEPPCGSGVTNPGTVQFKNGSTAISGTVSYSGISGAASANSQASCTATLTTSLSQFVPLSRPQPRLRMPFVLLWILAALAILFLALAQHAAPLQRKWPRLGNRLGYAAAGLLLLACLAASFAGCSGSSSGSGGGGGGSHTDSITAAYSGDTNYSGSTATAVSVTIQ
jgi:Pro-kumamolisin, activation domain/Bacterial Ig-like domain (group 3)